MSPKGRRVSAQAAGAKSSMNQKKQHGSAGICAGRWKYLGLLCVSLFAACAFFVSGGTDERHNKKVTIHPKDKAVLQKRISVHDVPDDWFRSQAGLLSPKYLEEDIRQFLDIGPRMVGTTGHATACSFITDRLTSFGWEVTLDPFSSFTPHGERNFTNMVANFKPMNTLRFQKISLACHYDSKVFPDFAFLGATDSAVPCMMLLDIARTLSPQLRSKAQTETASQEFPALELIFFDGEEAFETWTEDDSLYGARHLADRRENSINSASGENELKAMELLVLLDLLGAAKPTFYNMVPQFSQPYQSIRHIEQRLRQHNILDKSLPEFFKSGISPYGTILDDHIPFLQRGVKVLHLIAVPFPSVWHKKEDDLSALDFPTIHALQKIICVFVAHNLGLSPQPLPVTAPSH